MRRGRPRNPGTELERAEARKVRTRRNVAAFRLRQKQLGSEKDENQKQKGLTIIFEKAVYDSTKPLDKDVIDLIAEESDSYSSSAFARTSTRHHDQVPEVTWSEQDGYYGVFSTTEPKGKSFSKKSLVPTSQPVQREPLSGIFYQLEEATVYQDTFLQLLIDRYIPGGDSVMSYDFKGTSASSTLVPKHVTCSTWIMHSYNATKQLQAEILRDSLLALALSIASKENSDPRILHAARQIYNRALARLQTSFAHLSDQSLTNRVFTSFLGLACLACAISEIIANKDQASFGKHLDGIATLIQSRGPESLECELARALFYEHRAIYIMKCVLMRQTAFYGEKRWIEAPWIKRNSESQSPYHRLMEEAYAIPEAFVRFDDPQNNGVEDLLSQLENAKVLDARLDAWEARLAASVRSPLLRIRTASLAQSIDFATFGTATAMVYFFAFKIHVAELMVDIIDALPDFEVGLSALRARVRARSLRYARMICRSMEYCFDSQTKLVGKLIAMFPFETAWNAFRQPKVAGQKSIEEEGFDGEAWCAGYAGNFAAWGLPFMLDPESRECL